MQTTLLEYGNYASDQLLIMTTLHHMDGKRKNGQTVWTSEEFPDNIEAILVGGESSNEDSDDSDDNELESDYSGIESSNEDDNE